VITARAFAGKRYGVYGLARSGRATVAALAASGADVFAWDDVEAARAGFDGPLTDLNGFDLSSLDALVVSPGVPHSAPLFVAAEAAGIPVIGDIELFAQARAGLPPHKVVGITGTNGKSTTTALVHHILQTAGVPSLMGGNIGLPILAQAPLPEGGVYVLELSSYQLEITQTLDCDVAVLLNITPDHLGQAKAVRDANGRPRDCRKPRRSSGLGDRDTRAVTKDTDTYCLGQTKRTGDLADSTRAAQSSECCCGECDGSVARRARRLYRCRPPHLPRPAAPDGARP